MRIMTTENNFEFEGIKYQAIPGETCIGCDLEFVDPCILSDDQPYCMASMRQDKQDVIWQRENHE
jgi:hypothetical protein